MNGEEFAEGRQHFSKHKIRIILFVALIKEVKVLGK
jgi:hypothetical protein